jgi:hypothetical protein
MPISYRSIIHQPIDYTAPVDLNLLGKVLQYKQAQYDSGVQKVQGHLDALASMDIVKDSDKQYLNAKLNNLVSGINGMGGVDYSDSNTTNQIAGLSSQIYGDDNVIGAVANTKKFRYVQKYYQDLKEKKPKEYNPANEDFDMGRFESWLSDGEVGTSPEAGAGKVTPFADYRANHMKMFEKIAGNMTTEWTEKGMMLRKDEKTVYTAQEVMSAAAKLLTPAERLQMAIDGRYQYKHVDDMSLAKAYDEKIYKQANDIQSKLDTYKVRLKGATTVKDKQEYSALIARTEKELQTALNPISKNANQIRESLYANQYFQGLAERYSFSKVKSTMQLNSGEAFRQRQNLAVAEFQYQQQKDAADQEIERAKNDLIWYTDPVSGLRTLIKNPNAPKKTGDSSGTPSPSLPGLGNAGEDQRQEFDKEKLDNRKTELVKGNETLKAQYMEKFSRLYNIPEYVVKDYMDDGQLSVKITPEAEQILKDKMATWEAMTRGEKINFGLLDEGFKKMVVQYQENNKEIEAIDKLYTNVDKAVMEKYSITPEAYNKYQRYKQAKTNLEKAKLSAGTAGSSQAYNQIVTRAQTEYAKVINELNGGKGLFGGLGFDVTAMDSYEKNKYSDRNTLIKEFSTRYNLPTQTITDDKDKTYAKMIAGNATTLQWYNVDGTEGKKLPLNVDNITAAQKGYSMLKGPNGWVKQPVVMFQYKTGTGTEDFEQRQVPLTPQQAQALGFGTEFKDLSGYRFALHTGGEVNNVWTTSGKTYNLKYDVGKENMNDPNDDKVYVRVYNGDHSYLIHEDTVGQNFNSLEAAQEYMEKLTQYKSIDVVYKYLAKMTGEE